MHVSGEAVHSLPLPPPTPHPPWSVPNWAAFSAYFLACAAAVGRRTWEKRDEMVGGCVRHVWALRVLVGWVVSGVE